MVSKCMETKLDMYIKRYIGENKKIQTKIQNLKDDWKNASDEYKKEDIEMEIEKIAAQIYRYILLEVLDDLKENVQEAKNTLINKNSEIEGIIEVLEDNFDTKDLKLINPNEVFANWRYIKEKLLEE